MLQSARFENFTCLPNAQWEFSPGVNVIVGENGVGKTHLLKAAYALLKVLADSKELTKTALERTYAEKLVAVFRAESLGRLTKRKQSDVWCIYSFQPNVI
jgi:recombinational DNA repair ATPase RecF